MLLKSSSSKFLILFSLIVLLLLGSSLFASDLENAEEASSEQMGQDLSTDSSSNPIAIESEEKEEAQAQTQADLEQQAKDEEEFRQMLLEYQDIVEYDGDGRISKITSFDKSYDIFYYSDVTGKLQKISSFDANDRPIEETIFYRDSKTGQMLGYSKSNSFAFFSTIDSDNDLFLKANNDSYSAYNTFFSSLILTSDEKNPKNFSYTDAGELEVKSASGNITVYDREGRVRRDGNDTYFYREDGVGLERIERRDEKDNLLSVAYYDEGNKFVREEYFENNLISKIVFADATGKYEEYYENGKLYATVYYFEDNKKVKKIEYAE